MNLPSSDIKKSTPFLSGGGEMGQLIRDHDWSASSLGPIENWPQSLITTLSIIINSKFPMFLFWGSELICFYNDAYRPSLGSDGKHPNALGKPGSEIWPEIWPEIKPMIDHVLSRCEATWSEDQLLPIFRNGRLEDVYWTFSYSPVIDESGLPAGVFVTCNETTKAVGAMQKLQLSEQRFQNLVRDATVGIIVLMGKEFRIDMVNDAYAKLIGRTVSELMGGNLFDIIPETEEHFKPIIESVFLTGKPLNLYDYPYSVKSEEGTKDGFLNIVYQPYRESDGVISGVMILCQDVTDQVNARKQSAINEHLLQKVIEESPIRKVLLIGKELRIEMVNDAMLRGWSRKREDVLGLSIREVLPEVEDQPYFKILDEVFRTGKEFEGKESQIRYIRDGKWHTFYFDYWFRPILDFDGNVYGILLTSVDVTEKVHAERAIRESEHRFRDVVENAPFPIGVFTGKELRIQLANQTMLDTWGKGDDVIGKLYTEVLPELENQEIFDQIRSVYNTGIPFHAKSQRVDLVIDGELKPFYFNYSFTPLYSVTGAIYGVMNTAADVTDVNLATRKAALSESNLRNTILQAPVAMCILKDKEHYVEIANERMLELWGKTHDEVSHKPIMEGLEEIKGQGFDLLLDHVFSTGETYKAYDVRVYLKRITGIQTVYVDFVYEAFRDTDGKISGVLVVASDVTEQVVARQKIEQAEESARLAIESADLGKYEVDLLTDTMRTSERFDEIWGVDHSLKRKEYASYIHPDDQHIRISAHLESLKTGNLHYEARLVWEDESVHWVRVKGKVLYNDNNTPVTLLGVIQDINEQKLFAEELTKQVKERTAELQRSNEDLLHFAHVASHDLKEPVRKIKVFSNMLSEEFAGQLPDRGKNFVSKIQNATDRMFSMIDGVLAYSTLNSGGQPIERIDLNEVMLHIETDLEVIINRKQATIKKGKMPEIEGASVLIYQLFYNLVNNSLKFSSQDRKPIITFYSNIIAKSGRDFAEIVLTDNGIGLEQQYAEQIFNAFARLNAKDQYEGTGLGLALCKKIVERHDGTISATGIKNEGAVFTVLLPVKQIKKII
ncbi:MAG: PAS domain S-box protein [Flavobacterium sp.]|nr:MAG: PAS domain S-box protein [Flavobacterium sp.]